jgi:PHD/YefM family antitoxin component YafN of YafNO toxin-antitoxin module
MSIHTVSSREFTRDVSAAKRAANDGPVFITDRGEPAHVLLTIEEYQRLAATQGPNLAQLLAMPDADAVDFDAPKVNIALQIPDLER